MKNIFSIKRENDIKQGMAKYIREALMGKLIYRVSNPVYGTHSYG